MLQLMRIALSSLRSVSFVWIHSPLFPFFCSRLSGQVGVSASVLTELARLETSASLDTRMPHVLKLLVAVR